MNRCSVAPLPEHFTSLPDPRVNRTKDHLLTDILKIAICAVIGGADSGVSIEQFGKAKEQWFRSFLGSGSTYGVNTFEVVTVDKQA